jgi:hypothetical protein
VAGDDQYQAVPAIDRQTSVKMVGGRGTSVSHMLALVFEDPSMDGDRRDPWLRMRLSLGRCGPAAGSALAWSVPLRATGG